ncbi:hypothetical protein LguiA_032746 [Lonicera macranthoides]
MRCLISSGLDERGCRATVILRNSKIDIFKGSMRLAVDKWGHVEVDEPASFSVKEDTWPEAIVETDPINAVNLINKDDIENHSDKTIIRDCMTLKETMCLELTYMLREGNKRADYMSKLGRTLGEQAMRVMVPTTELVMLLKAAMQRD